MLTPAVLVQPSLICDWNVADWAVPRNSGAATAGSTATNVAATSDSATPGRRSNATGARHHGLSMIRIAVPDPRRRDLLSV